jgi:hypothetical protein
MSNKSILLRITSDPDSNMDKWASMKYWLPIFLIFNYSLLISSCGLDVEDPTPPSPPVWVQKSFPEEWPERGIDAHEGGGIYLEWESNVNEDIAAYILYRANWIGNIDSIGNYVILARLETDSPSFLEYIDDNVELRERYYYKLRVEDTTGNVSDFSDSIFYTLLSQLNDGQMQPNGVNHPLREGESFYWFFPHSLEMEDYCLTITSGDYEFVARVIILPGNYTGEHEYWQLPEDIHLESGKIYKWRIDAGARYIDGRETSGSESHWAVFLYL